MKCENSGKEWTTSVTEITNSAITNFNGTVVGTKQIGTCSACGRRVEERVYSNREIKQQVQSHKA